jgi:alkanesulfonate monooxygenase SsuD/methylene tetrahydromethanopterin reductase-like flavin-dependent oxidoreductase (luciferase family)
VSVEVGVGLWTMQSTRAHPSQPTAAYRRLVEDARRVEALGLGSLWTAEHHGWYDGWCPRPMEALAPAAAATERLRLGTAILAAPLHDAGRLAADARTLHRLSDGRLVLGVGQGHRDAEFDLFGRARRARAGLLEAALDPLEAAGPPILLGGMSEAAGARAARRGHGLLLPQTLDADRLAAVVRAYRAAGGSGTIGVMRDVWVTRSGAAARERFLPALGDHYREEIGAWWPLKGRWPGFAAPEELARQLERVRRSAAVGEPGQVAEALAALVAAGAELLVLRLRFDFTADADLEDALALVADDVVPRLA